MNRWLVPATALVVGGVWVAIGFFGGSPSLGVAAAGVMVAYAVLLLAVGGTEIGKVLHGKPSDERYVGMAVRALAFSGLVTPLCLLAVGLYEISTGANGQPYVRLCLLSVAAFLVALLWLRWRS